MYVVRLKTQASFTSISYEGSLFQLLLLVLKLLNVLQYTEEGWNIQTKKYHAKTKVAPLCGLTFSLEWTVINRKVGLGEFPALLLMPET